MRNVQKKFLELVKSRHPDGGEGSENDFIELFEAKEFLLNYIKNYLTIDDDVQDEEEYLIRKSFDHANIQKINIDSVTIQIPTEHVLSWRKVLESHFGAKIVLPSKVDSVQFKTENGLSITSWLKEKSTMSTILIQGRKRIS